VLDQTSNGRPRTNERSVPSTRTTKRPGVESDGIGDGGGEDVQEMRLFPVLGNGGSSCLLASASNG